jgi:hypothetical protein
MIVIVSPTARRIDWQSLMSSPMPKPSLSLIAAKPASAPLLRLVDQIRYCITPALAVEPGRIGLHAATQRATHQLMQRQPEIPTFQVP